MKTLFYHQSFIISHFLILKMKIASEGDKNDDVIISCAGEGVMKVAGEGGASLLQFLKTGKCHNKRNYKNNQLLGEVISRQQNMSSSLSFPIKCLVTNPGTI